MFCFLKDECCALGRSREKTQREHICIYRGRRSRCTTRLSSCGGRCATTPAGTQNSHSRGIQRTRVQVSAPFFVVLFQAFSVFERVALRKKKNGAHCFEIFWGFLSCVFGVFFLWGGPFGDRNLLLLSLFFVLSFEFSKRFCFVFDIFLLLVIVCGRDF